MAAAKVGKHKAANVTITDTGLHYASTNVEDALQELDNGSFDLNANSIALSGGYVINTTGIYNAGILVINTATEMLLRYGGQSVITISAAQINISYPGTSVIIINSAAMTVTHSMSKFTSEAATTEIQIDNIAADGDPILWFTLSGTKAGFIGLDDTDDSIQIGTGAAFGAAGINITSTQVIANKDLLINKKAFLGGWTTASIGDTTPSARNNFLLILNNILPTSVTDFDTETDGQILIVLNTGAAATIIDGAATIQLSGSTNLVMNATDTLMLVNRSGIWYEINRSDNS